MKVVKVITSDYLKIDIVSMISDKNLGKLGTISVVWLKKNEVSIAFITNKYQVIYCLLMKMIVVRRGSPFVASVVLS